MPLPSKSSKIVRIQQQGLCALGNQEGSFHLAPYMCVLDIMSIDCMGGVLHRTMTLATGGVQALDTSWPIWKQLRRANLSQNLKSRD